MEVLIESSNVEVKPVARRGANSQNANRYDPEPQKQCLALLSLSSLIQRLLLSHSQLFSVESFTLNTLSAYLFTLKGAATYTKVQLNPSLGMHGLRYGFILTNS